MKLQKQLSRKSENTIYPKWVVVIPPKDIEKLGWKEGEELETKVKNGKLVIKRD